MMYFLRSFRFGFTLALACLISASSAKAGGGFLVTNLVTDDQSANPAKLTDPDLVNAWGVSFGPTSPFWVSDNGTGKSTLYSVNPTTDAVTKNNAIIVTIPGDGSVTGQSFNANASMFNGDRFLFVSEDGTVSGWRNALGSSAETLVTASDTNVYKGAALVVVGGNSYLLAANFRSGLVDVIKGSAGAPNLASNFVDPTIPSGYAPFNVQLLGGKVYVTYALQDDDKADDVAGAGHGYVSVFSTDGSFLGRVASGSDPNSPLNSPWGLAIAPTSFGSLAGDLLVGNFGSGQIAAFNLGTNSFDGTLASPNGNPLVIDGLWAITTGNGTTGSTSKLYFTAGPQDESHGLFGVISSVPEPSTYVLLGLGVLGMLIQRRFVNAS